MTDNKILKSLHASQRWAEAAQVNSSPAYYHFTAEVWLWSGGEAKASWYFVTMPEALGQTIKQNYGQTHASRNGLIRVEAKIGQTKWQTSLLWHNPTKSYLVALKAAVRKSEEVTVGEKLTLEFSPLPIGAKKD